MKCREIATYSKMKKQKGGLPFTASLLFVWGYSATKAAAVLIAAALVMEFGIETTAKLPVNAHHGYYLSEGIQPIILRKHFVRNDNLTLIWR
jgi:dTDP-D-glucose 4,6-dehydratase